VTGGVPIGNAALGRLLRARARTLARFGEPEHKAIGDAALDVRWRLPGSTLFKELELTLGDWIALGDWFEDVAQVKEHLRAHRDRQTVGQVYYAVLVRVRPRSEAERKAAEAKYMGVLFDEKDKAAVDARYALLKTRNIKHFPNPLVGDTARSTREKAERRRDGKPLGAIAQYRSDHLEAVALAASAGQLGDERLLGEALAIDGFACHFLTDMFSGSHTRTPRASIETYWDAKVPEFDRRLAHWLADEVAFVIDTAPSNVKEFVGSLIEQSPFAPLDLVRRTARKEIRAVLPPLSFGDVVGLVVHDWEGAHGKDEHGPLVTVGGHQLRLVGDERLLPAATAFDKRKSDAQLRAVLKDRRRSAAERTFAGATLAVRASVGDVQRAYELGRKRRKRADIIALLIGRDGLFAPERLIPQVVPEAKLPPDDRMPKWDYATVDQLLADPKIRSALPESARKVAEPFEDTLAELKASGGVKRQLRLAVIKPLTSGNVAAITAWVKSVIDYSPRRLEDRLRAAWRGREDLIRVIQERH
jgi:hypothetical protein